MNSSLDNNLSQILENCSSSVKSVGFGKKTIRNHTIDHNAIIFAVDKKKHIEELDKNEVIPSIIKIEGTLYSTDVVENNFVPHIVNITGCSGVGIDDWNNPHQEKLDKIRCGTSIGINEDNFLTTGTIGTIVFDKVDETLCALTTSHNIIRDGFLTGNKKYIQENGGKPIDNNIYQDEIRFPITKVSHPSADDSNNPKFIGTVKRYYPLKKEITNYIDAAIFALEKKDIDKNSWQQLNFITNEDIKDASIINTIESISENSDIRSDIFISDIIVEDNDEYRSYYVDIYGPDAHYFKIVYPDQNNNYSRSGNPKLYLKAYTLLNYKKKTTYNITLSIYDPNSTTRGQFDETTGFPKTTSSPVILDYILEITEDNNIPTISVSGIVNIFPEDYPTNSGIHLADVTINDPDGLGENVLSLHGADQQLFEIKYNEENDKHELYFKANPNGFNYEVQNQYSVIIKLTDFALVTKPYKQSRGIVADYYNFGIVDVNEFPIAGTVIPLITNIYEETFYVNGQTFPLPYNLKVAEVIIVDDLLGINKIALTGPDVQYFFVEYPDSMQDTTFGKAPIYLKAGTVLDFETKNQFNINVVIYDELLPDYTIVDSYTLDLIDRQDPSTEIFLTNVVNNLNENIIIDQDLKLADMNFIDQDSLFNNYLLVAEHSENFKIIGNSLYLIADTVLDYEYIQQYYVRIYGFNPAIEGSIPVYVDYVLNVNDLNDGQIVGPGPDPRPQIVVSPIVSNLAENTSTLNRIAVANISISQPVLGNPLYELELYGPNANDFEIESNVLYLKSGITFNYELQKRFSVIVVLQRSGFNISSDQYFLNITNVNNGPTSISLFNVINSIRESLDTSYAKIPLANISYTDDNIGNNTLFISGNDSDFFEIEQNVLYLKQNTILDYETKPQYNILINVQDVDAIGINTRSVNYTLNIIDTNENAIYIQFVSDPVTVLVDDIDVSSPIYLGTLFVDDQDIDPLYRVNTVEVFGADSSIFSIITNANTYDLYLNAGTILDSDAKDQYSVILSAIDYTSKGNIPVFIPYVLDIIRGNKSPARIEYLELVTRLDHAYFETGKTPLALIQVIDPDIDETSPTYEFSIDGPDAAGNFFSIEAEDDDSAILYLNEGIYLDFFEKQRYSITISAVDTLLTEYQQSDYTITKNYVLDVLQPYYPFATKTEIDSLVIGKRVWFVGRTSGFSGQNDCPLELKQTNVATTVSKYIFDTIDPMEAKFGGCLAFGYKNGSDTVVYPGDSGAVLLASFDGIIKIIGLIFAAGKLKNEDPDDSLGYACRIDKVAELLEIDSVDLAVYFSNEKRYSDPTKWKFLFYDKLTNSYKRKVKSGVVDNEVKYDTYYQCGTYDITLFDEE